MVMENVIIEKVEKVVDGYGSVIIINFIWDNIKCSIYFGESKNGKAIYGGGVHQTIPRGIDKIIYGKSIKEVSNYLKTQYNTNNIK